MLFNLKKQALNYQKIGCRKTKKAVRAFRRTAFRIQTVLFYLIRRTMTTPSTAFSSSVKASETCESVSMML